jgi:Domain of unknown function (DUF4124)
LLLAASQHNQKMGVNMYNTKPHYSTLLAMTALCASFTLSVQRAEAAYKCQGADGKVEYSDRPCDTSKNTLVKPRENNSVVSRSVGDPMAQLEKYFVAYEPRLCEREKVAAEIDGARQRGEIATQPAKWKTKMDRQAELNEVLVEFQARAGKITKAAGNDSHEMMAVRKFQLGLRTCDLAKPYASPASSPEPTAPNKAAATKK